MASTVPAMDTVDPAPLVGTLSAATAGYSVCTYAWLGTGDKTP